MTKHLVNIVSNLPMLEPFGGAAGLKRYIENDCGCFGAEVISCPPYGTDTVRNCTVGYHLMFYPNWIDFYRGNSAYLKEHFGEEKAWREYYCCEDDAGFEAQLIEDMDRAESLGAEYAVMHCADISNEEVLLGRTIHTNEEVIRTTAELMNRVMRKKNYSFILLFENLFVPGMTLINADETRLLFDLVEYKNKGIMLDTGHLMAALRLSGKLNEPSESAAADGILSVLHEHGELIKYIKGMHLHRCSLDMPIEEYTLPQQPHKDFAERSGQCYARILALDTHSPLETAAMHSVIDAVKPKYIVHELSAATPAAKAEAVQKQLRSIRDLCR